MALIVLILVGAAIGWLETVRIRLEDNQAIVIHMLWGALGALLLGLIANDYVFWGGLDLYGLAGGLVGAVVGALLRSWWLRRNAS